MVETDPKVYSKQNPDGQGPPLSSEDYKKLKRVTDHLMSFIVEGGNDASSYLSKSVAMATTTTTTTFSSTTTTTSTGGGSSSSSSPSSSSRSSTKPSYDEVHAVAAFQLVRGRNDDQTEWRLFISELSSMVSSSKGGTVKNNKDDDACLLCSPFLPDISSERKFNKLIISGYDGQGSNEADITLEMKVRQHLKHLPRFSSDTTTTHNNSDSSTFVNLLSSWTTCFMDCHMAWRRKITRSLECKTHRAVSHFCRIDSVINTLPTYCSLKPTGEQLRRKIIEVFKEKTLLPLLRYEMLTMGEQEQQGDRDLSEEDRTAATTGKLTALQQLMNTLLSVTDRKVAGDAKHLWAAETSSVFDDTTVAPIARDSVYPANQQLGHVIGGINIDRWNEWKPEEIKQWSELAEDMFLKTIWEDHLKTHHDDKNSIEPVLPIVEVLQHLLKFYDSCLRWANIPEEVKHYYKREGMITETAQKLDLINKRDLAEVKAIMKPPPVMEDALEVVYYVLEKKKTTHGWTDHKKLWSNAGRGDQCPILGMKMVLMAINTSNQIDPELAQDAARTQISKVKKECRDFLDKHEGEGDGRKFAAYLPAIIGFIRVLDAFDSTLLPRLQNLRELGTIDSF